MPWFDRAVAGSDAKAAYRELAAAVQASGLVAALDAASGPFGLRRFIVRFDVRGGRARVSAVDSERLPAGGGPPAAFEARAAAVEAALTALHRGLSARFPFARGAAAFVRGAEGAPALSLRLEEDADLLRLSDLDTPAGPAHPCESPAYLAALGDWAGRMEPIRARWSVDRGGGGSFSEGRLHANERDAPAAALATWHPGQSRLEWLLESPAGEEAPMVEPELSADLAMAMDLVLYAAARLGCTGMFQGEDETGRVVFVGIQ
jgi:hypothetical protein